MQDPYDVLGASRTATPAELQKLYRKLAKTHHPDLNPGDKAAEERFKAVTAGLRTRVNAVYGLRIG